MIKKTITYEDFNGNERTDDFYFNLSKAELIDMANSMDGEFPNYIQKIIDANDGLEILKVFKEVLIKSYGVKSEDGLRFIKSEKLTEEFMQTNAFSEIYMELSSNEEAASAFINGVIPKDILMQAQELSNENHPALIK